MLVRLTETTPLSEAGTATSTGRMRVHAITAGVGSSGYYSPEVLQEAATNELIRQGTPLFLDHASETDRHDRPERSVRDIAAVFTGPATYDATEQALVGEIQVFAPYRELLTEMAPHIGLSISGSATDVTEGEHDGRRVPVIEGLHSIDSVDFVTRAGRGGRVVDLLEAERTNRRAVGRGVAEATVNDTREALNTVLRDAYGSDSAWVYVRDFDETTVWFDLEGEGDESGIYAQPYTQSDGGAVELTGERTEVRVVTTYVPATRPDGTTTEESEEDTMPNHSIEEAERLLGEANGRVTTLESERDTAIRERDEARRQLAATQRVGRAQVLITERAAEASITFDSLQVRGLLADLPVTESGDFDEAAFTTRVDEAAAEISARGGAGTVTGFGGTTTTSTGTQVTEADIDNAVGSAFGRQVKGA